MKVTIIIGGLVLLLTVVCSFWNLFKKPIVAVQECKLSNEAKVNALDPVFTAKVQPVANKFFDALDRAGVSPIKGNPHYHSVRIHHGPQGITCQFLVSGSCGVTAYVGSRFAGVMHYAQKDAPFGAISRANTNQLSRMAKAAVKMPKSEAERIITQVSDALAIDYSRFEKVEIYPERMFDYDLGMWTAQYRTRGRDPIFGSSYAISLTIKATSPTTAELVNYMNDGQNGQ